MATVQCVKCGQSRDGLAMPPFRAGTKLADVGAEIQQKICGVCYKDWIAMSVKLVNEMRLDTTNPQHQQLWLGQMRSFLALDGGTADPWTRFLDKRVRVETRDGTKAVATLIGSDSERLRFAEFEGGAVPAGFTASDEHARGSASIARDAIVTIEAA